MDARVAKNAIAGTLLAALVAAGYFLITDQENVLAVEFDGKIITTEYTDDNTGEDLIIRTDRETYGGFDEIPVFFSIENTSKNDQNVDIRFLFENAEQTVEVYEIISQESYQVVVPVFGEVVDGEPSVIGTTTETRKRDRLAKVTALEKAKEASQKEIPANFKAEAAAYPHFIPAGEIRFYKAVIKVEPRTRAEWMIETHGSSGGYGQMR